MSALQRLIDNPRELTLELATEITREHWIAVQAAARIAGGEPLMEIESEALDALHAWVGFELQDRSHRSK